MSKHVRFIGGPWDGRTMAVETGRRDVNVLDMMTSDAPGPGDFADPFDTHSRVYHYRIAEVAPGIHMAVPSDWSFDEMVAYMVFQWAPTVQPYAEALERMRKRDEEKNGIRGRYMR